MAAEFPVFPRTSLYLPGTVALPSPFPTVGHIWLQSPKLMAGLEDEETELVAIGTSVSPTTTIVRYVHVEHVSAILFLDKVSEGEESNSIDWKKGFFSPSLDDIKRGLANSNRAIVYVPESAPVITQAIFGQTAAESAEYVGWRLGPCDCA
ncbi:MAG TPA: hypothetical protein VKB78_17330 [Pirellulales bacterium]|nr:hypothetical protein [Pirellulales bacterium]